MEQTAQFEQWQETADKEYPSPEVVWDSPHQESDAAQVLQKIHIMRQQQAENARIRREKEEQRQKAIREEEERVARLKVHIYCHIWL